MSSLGIDVGNFGENSKRAFPVGKTYALYTGCAQFINALGTGLPMTFPQFFHIMIQDRS